MLAIKLNKECKTHSKTLPIIYFLENKKISIWYNKFLILDIVNVNLFFYFFEKIINARVCAKYGRLNDWVINRIKSSRILKYEINECRMEHYA